MTNIRLNKVLKELNISMQRAIDFLQSEGIEVDARPTTKIDEPTHQLLVDQFQQDAERKAISDEVSMKKKIEKEAFREEQLRAKEEKEVTIKEENIIKTERVALKGLTSVGKIDLGTYKKELPKEEVTSVEEIEEAPEVDLEKVEAPVSEVIENKTEPQVPVVVPEVKIPEVIVEEQEKEQISIVENIEKEEVLSLPEKEVKSEAPADSNVIETKYRKLEGPKITGEKVDLSQFKKRTDKKPIDNKKKRVRIKKEVNIEEEKKKAALQKTGTGNRPAGSSPQRRPFQKGGKPPHRPVVKTELSEEDVQKQIKETLQRLTNKGAKSKGVKHRKDKRQRDRDARNQEIEREEQESKILKVTEFVTVNELATMMNVSVTSIISSCMTLGLMVTMNQRLDAETLTLVASEFDFDVEFIDAEVEEAVQEEVDKAEDLKSRAPIVTIMGHVDHGKTSLLDYIRETNVIAGESGGITQHIGAYAVELKSGEHITFLDTPGHEAFTAMRARGAQLTDIAIIVVAADDDIMPQTKEAIAHAQVAEVPIIFAINKIDKPAANPEKIKEQLANMNLLVEDWGGKIQSQDISAKVGTNVVELLEKVLLEAEILDLKANPDKVASGTVIEASLDKGRGYLTTLLVQAGTMNVGDYVLAGSYHGKVRAILDERGKKVSTALPAQPVSILGLDGAPQAGDKFKVFEDEKEAKQIATRRLQLQREQSVRTQKHLTLDVIGRRIALGDFKELNIILKGDVDGSVEALSDSLQKLSVEEIEIKVIHKGVGQITESDVLLATASDAVIIGFNVRPGVQAKTLAEKEEIEIRLYSIIYDAINDVKEAMEGMLSPEMKEEITGNIEIREVFKISKVGTIAGCMVLDGKVARTSRIRLIREGVVVCEGELASLKRFKDDVKEVSKGYECGLNIKNYNDIREGDIIESYREVEVKKRLK